MRNPIDTFERWLIQSDGLGYADVAMYREFYKGEHDIRLSKRQETRLGITSSQIRSLANICPLVVDTVAERLSVQGFTATSPATERALAMWWAARDLSAYQDDIHLSALRDADSYVIVGWDDAAAMPEFHHEMAYDGTNGTGIIYSSERRVPLYGFKKWRLEEGDDRGKSRLNLYFDNRIEKYITGRAGAWTEYHDSERWPIPWVDATGQPLGVPVVHFPTNPNGDDYGTSELEAVIPLQRVLTSLWVDLIAAADATGFQLVTLTGDVPSEEMVNAARAIWYSQNPAAAWGTIPPGDLSLLVEAVRHATMTIAQVSRVPLTMFQDSRAVAAADTIVASERGLIAKIADRAKTYGLSWRRVMRYAVRLHNTFGPRPALDEAGIVTNWDSFEELDYLTLEKSRAAVAASHLSNGLSMTAAYTLAGYSAAELAAIARTDTYGEEGLTQ